MPGLKILHFLGIGVVPKRPLVDPTGGTERVVLEIARRQAAQGHRVTVASITSESWSGSWEGVELLRLTPLKWAALNIGGHRRDLTEQLRLALLIWRRQFDIVHLHEHQRTRLLPSARTFLQFHNNPLPAPNAEAFRAGATRFWREVGRAAVQIGVSGFVGRRLAAVHEAAGPGAGRQAITVNQSGVDLAFFDHSKLDQVRMQTRQKLGLGADDVLFMFAGAFLPVKGVDVLAKAFMRLLSEHPNASLAIAGGSRLWSKPGEALAASVVNFEAEILNMLEPAIRNGRAYPLGVLSPGDIRPVYAAADVFVLPSTFQETFGLVILEAFACGLPVIASRSGGIPELVRDGENGILFEIGDSDALLEAMRELLLDAAKRERYSQEALRVASRYSWDETVRRLEGIYERRSR